MLKVHHISTRLGVYDGNDCIANIFIDARPNLSKKIDILTKFTNTGNTIEYRRTGSADSVKHALDMIESVYVEEQLEIKGTRSETIYEISFHGDTIGHITENQPINSYRATPTGQVQIGVYKTQKSAIAALVRHYLDSKKGEK